MARVVHSRHDAKRSAARASSAAARPLVVTKRVKASDGTSVTMHTLDASSASFGEEFTQVFRRNVGKARRANTETIGAPDRVPAKH